MSGCAQGTFSNIGEPSQVLGQRDASSPNLAFKLSTIGVDANNTVKTQKSINGGMGATLDADWTDVTTYNAEQTNTVITPAAGETWRLVAVALQASHDIKWKLSRES